MVVGMDKFKAHFAGFEDSFVIIGGAACDLWLASKPGRRFRPTKDIDMVLILEPMQPKFLTRIKQFVKDGGYKPYSFQDGGKAYYRFVEPATTGYPKMIEMFSGKPLDLKLGKGQTAIPVDDKLKSLSAILMDDVYHELTLSLREAVYGLPLITPPGLIALKVKAWLDLGYRRDAGAAVDLRDIKKHRNDVFRLAELLEEETTTTVPERILADIRQFLDAMELDRNEWTGILQSLGLKGGKIVSGRIEAIRNHFR